MKQTGISLLCLELGNYILSKYLGSLLNLKALLSLASRWLLGQRSPWLGLSAMFYHQFLMDACFLSAHSAKQKREMQNTKAIKKPSSQYKAT